MLKSEMPSAETDKTLDLRQQFAATATRYDVMLQQRICDDKGFDYALIGARGLVYQRLVFIADRIAPTNDPTAYVSVMLSETERLADAAIVSDTFRSYMRDCLAPALVQQHEFEHRDMTETYYG